MNDHLHLWHVDAGGVVRCAFQDCQAEPDEVAAAEAMAEVETRDRMRVTFAVVPMDRPE